MAQACRPGLLRDQSAEEALAAGWEGTLVSQGVLQPEEGPLKGQAGEWQALQGVQEEEGATATPWVWR